MFELESYGSSKPPIVAKQKPVPVEAKKEIKQLTEAAAARLREVMPDGTCGVIEMPKHFGD
jgi:hypothetical protein